MSDRKILLGVSGGVAAFKAVALTSLLRQSQAQVEVIMTKAATQLIGPASFQAFTGRAVKTNIFVAQESVTSNHIQLAQWADIFVIAPATANTLAGLSWGFGHNLLTCTALAVTCPILLAPAMNTHMWNNPIVRDNVRRLKEFGFHFVGPTQGHLSCGTSGPGRMVEAEEIYSAIINLLDGR
ncbi:MAG: phosphopantothenoylcysteine decarboxylase [Phycisphaerae bacterium]|nr:phosphopantothenoylcysteine decarboxylase [Phycisphaerae bacterium]